MKASFVVLAALVAAASAQIGQPDCATPCIADVLENPDSTCENIECYCKAETFITSVGQCIADKCGKEDIEKTIKAAYAVCLTAGVTINTNFPEATQDTATTSGTATITPPPQATNKNTTSNNRTSTTTTSTNAAPVNGIAQGAGVIGAFLAALMVL